MSEFTVTTNNQARDILYWYDLSEKEKAEFDYIDGDNREWAEFVKYKGRVYDLNEFIRVEPEKLPHSSPLKGWHGYMSDTFFSGVLIKYASDYEMVILGRFYS
jgi:hypothetical protein